MLSGACLTVAACGSDAPAPGDAATAGDAALSDGAARDAGARDAALEDAASADAALEDAASTDAGALDAGAASVCPPGSASLVLDLGGVALVPVAGVPVDDGFVSGFGIVEGPVWARDALYVSHFGGGPTPASRIYRLDATGVVTIAASSAGTNGLALAPDGRLHGARHSDGSISVFDWADLDAAPTPIVSTYLGARFDSPNDLTFRSDGALYFTDPDWQAPTTRPQAATRAYALPRGGVATPIDGAPARPNGITLSRDERTLFISGTDGLRRFDLAADGSIAAGPFDVPAVSGGLDGLGLDCAGNLYVTGNDRVVILDSALARIGELGAVGATNVAFGGADGRTLFVTRLGTPPGLLSASLNVPGLPY